MFVFQLSDGRFYKESGSEYITSKRNATYWGKTDYWAKFHPGGEHFEQFWTKNLDEAKLFKSGQAIRSSNAYQWGGTIKEVKVKIELV